ncbi:ABC transporter permease [Pseudoduganella ginsengisoli]|uniref:FtsX-like permease family protein n=1 Tax=Pseudoduganella ginsengisoli TaxID=1462440 RepID=A0A6L6PYF9_9BURK|nr:ABC transporter permease [Pseudoduganella ginsengisoli]MTW02505.1 FtsX-like permease family protein [Pseudoduganella ginsengisoli]
MMLRDFRIGWRLLLQERAYSAVTIIGLAAGLAACFLLLAYVRFSYSYESHVPQADRVYVAKTRIESPSVGGWYERSPFGLLGVAERSGLAEAAAVALTGGVTLRQGASLTELDINVFSTGMPKVLGLYAVQGDLQAALERPDAVALTESVARRLFGNTGSAIGKPLTLENISFNVAAVVPDPPAASSLKYQALFGLGSRLIQDEQRKSWERNWGGIVTLLYVRLAPGATPQAMLQALQHALDQAPRLAQSKAGAMHLGLTPLRGWYFDRDLASKDVQGRHGNPALVMGVGAIAGLILLLATINYVNLATVRVMRRRPEIALRKLLGAGRARVAGLLLAESMLVALLATTAGLLLAWLLLPACSQLLNRPLAAAAGIGTVLAALAIGAATGVLAGLYPAWVALHVRPAHALEGRGGQETHSTAWLRRTVTVLQMTAAMGLTATTLAVAWQTRYASAAEPGFDPRPLLVLDLPTQMWEGQAARQLRDALQRVSGVEGVAISPAPAGRFYLGLNNPVQRPDGHSAAMQERMVSPNFFHVYGVQALAGRLFDPQREQETNDGSVVLNAAAAKALGYATPQEAVGQTVQVMKGKGAVQPVVVGIVPDLRYQSLREQATPVIYRNSLNASVLTVRYRGDMADLERAADALWRQYFPDNLPDIRRAGSYYTENYADDARLAGLLAVASATALLLSAFGIYVLSAYTVQRRAREIVLRKLHGARGGAIARLLGREFAWMLGCAALLGLPAAALAIQTYLAPFAERAPIGGWTLLAALGAVAAVSLAATIRHTLAALRLPPALALRT